MQNELIYMPLRLIDPNKLKVPDDSLSVVRVSIIVLVKRQLVFSSSSDPT